MVNVRFRSDRMRIDNSKYRPSHHPAEAAHRIVRDIEVYRYGLDPLMKMGFSKLEQRGLVHLDNRGAYWPCRGAQCRRSSSTEHSAQNFWDWAELKGYTVNDHPSRSRIRDFPGCDE